MTIIDTTGQEGRYYVSKIEEDKSILCSVVSDSNVETLSTLLQNINAEQSKLDSKNELYILYQQLKDDAFCSAFEKRNSVAVTVLIQNDQETRKPVVNKDSNATKSGSNGFKDAQFSSPNTQGTKYKESKKNFYASLRNDAIRVVIIGLSIAAAVMTPSVAVAVVCSVIAALVAIGTGLHIKDSTLPSYRAMEENRVDAYPTLRNWLPNTLRLNAKLCCH